VKKEFRLPDVGEGLTEADIVAWHVKPGDTVTINQIIVDIETAKAVVELPSPYAGTVAALLVEEGQTIDVGVPIIAIDVTSAQDDGPAPTTQDDTQHATTDSTQDATEDNAQDATASDAAKNTPPKAPERQPVLVGYGVKPGSTSRRPRKKPPTRPGSYPTTPSGPPAGGPFAGEPVPPQGMPPEFPAGIKLPPGIPAPPPPVIPPQDRPAQAHPTQDQPAPARSRALAKPPVRRLARDLGIDLGGIPGSAPRGRSPKTT